MPAEGYPCISRCPCLKYGTSGVQLSICETIQTCFEYAAPDGYWFGKYHISYTYNAASRLVYPT